ncbi:MAG TPA: hypothetical protein VGY48_07220 [Vicinamibacterales bacterium]|nr:hypothetical protein [Vicinamibacterales bacterium]
MRLLAVFALLHTCVPVSAQSNLPGRQPKAPNTGQPANPTNPANPGNSETIDRVLAVVAGRLIMLSDVTASLELGLVQAPAAGVDPVRAVLSKLIDRELMLAEVDRYAPPDPVAEALDREAAAVRGRFASSAAFEGALARSGLDAAHLRERLRQDLRIRAYEDQRFTSTDPRRVSLIDDWVAGLRRRADVIDLYAAQ